MEIEETENKVPNFAHQYYEILRRDKKMWFYWFHSNINKDVAVCEGRALLETEILNNTTLDDEDIQYYIDHPLPLVTLKGVSSSLKKIRNFYAPINSPSQSF